MRGEARARPPFRRYVSLSEIGGNDETESFVEHMLPIVETLDDLREIYFDVAWRREGGSGLGVTIGDLESMPMADILWYRDRVNEERKAEAESLRSARAAAGRKK